MGAELIEAAGVADQYLILCTKKAEWCGTRLFTRPRCLYAIIYLFFCQFLSFSSAMYHDDKASHIRNRSQAKVSREV